MCGHHHVFRLFLKSNRTICIALIAIISGFPATRSAHAQEPPDDAAWKHYVLVLRSSTLEWQTTDPFLLKIEFQLHDLQGNPIEKGTAQESWSRDGRRFEVHSPSLVEVDGDLGGDPKNHNRESYLVRQALLSISRPFEHAIAHKDFSVQELAQSQGVDVKCFSLAGKAVAQDAPAYCTDVDNQLVEMKGQLFVLKRSDFRQFHNHEVPMDIELSYEGKPALRAHVTELDSIPVSSSSPITAKPASSTQIPGSVMSGLILKKPTPKYPKEAVKKKVTGSVLLTAVISKQGTMTAMDVIASPDPLLTRAAMEAVQTWTYQPYLLKGEPTEVDTTITVNFNLGS